MANLTEIMASIQILAVIGLCAYVVIRRFMFQGTEHGSQVIAHRDHPRIIGFDADGRPYFEH